MPASRPSSEVVASDAQELPLTPWRALRGHTAPLHVVVFNRDGSYCATGGQDRTINLWNPYRCANEADGESVKGESDAFLLRAYRGHGYDVMDIAIMPDSTRFASVGGDRCAFLWDTTTGNVLRKLFGHEQRLSACAVNGEGTLLLTGSHDMTARVWDVRAARGGGSGPVQVLAGFRDNVTRVAFSRAGDAIVASALDGCVRTFDLRAGRLLTDDVGAPITSLALSNDGNCTLTASPRDGGFLALLEAGRGTVLKRYTGGHTNSLYRLVPTFTSTDSHVVVGSEDGGVAFYDLVRGSVAARLHQAHQRVVSCVAVHPSPLASVMLTASFDGTAKLWGAASDNAGRFVVER